MNMNQNFFRSAIAATVAVLAVSPRAQGPTDAFSLRAEGRAACAPIHTKPADEGQPHGLWASGDDYKVSFDGGMQFVPYVGRDVLASPAFRWRTCSARLGDLELATTPARLTHGEWRAEYDLGSIVEAYDVHAAGVEQTFAQMRAEKAGPTSDEDTL